jgi:translation initiation factor 3 subunit J
MLPGSKNADLDALISAQPRTKDDFTKLSSQIVEFIIKRHQSKPLYATFAEQLARDIAEPLKDVEIRKVASALTTLANEKQKEARDKASGKKKKGGKPALGGAKAVKAFVTSVFSCSPLTITLPVPILVSTMKLLMISETIPMTLCNLYSLLA